MIIQEWLDKHGHAHLCPWGCNRLIGFNEGLFNSVEHFFRDEKIYHSDRIPDTNRWLEIKGIPL